MASNPFAFLVDTYRTEIQKTLSVWSMADDDELDRRPRAGDRRGRTLREHMVHQCTSEHAWFHTMLGINVTGEPLPKTETRGEFLRVYARDAAARLAALTDKDADWWLGATQFFGEERNRAWVMTRRLNHSAHHRGQQTMLLRSFGKALHSTYGPSADTGGLGKDGAAVIYAYADVPTLLREEAGARRKAALPPPAPRAVTERPDG
jgi:uncharacterized damage-inducible protein DinB